MQFNITPNWKVSLLCLITLPILLSLGFWQLDRAEQKREHQQRLEQLAAAPPVSLTRDRAGSLPEQHRLLLRGRYLPSYNWLLDNRQRQGRVGYEVITPFELEDGALVLVNRGWIPAGANRDQRPDPSAPPGPQTLFGQLVSPSEHPLLEEVELAEGWPIRRVTLAPEAMAAQLGRPLLGRYVRLEDTSPGALVTNWPDTQTSAAKHLGYAFQWFAMALALVIWFLFANTAIRRRWRKDEQHLRRRTHTGNFMTETDQQTQAPNAKRGRLTAAALMLTVALPMLLAYLLYATGLGLPDTTVNQGELLSPPQGFADWAPRHLGGDSWERPAEPKRWRLLVPISGDCRGHCRDNLYLTRQVHLRLAQKAYRVKRLILVEGPLDAETADYIEAEHPGVELLRVDSAAMAQSLSEAGRPDKAHTDGEYYLMDQDGFVMMAYNPGHTGEQLLKDIKRLLRYSYEN